MVYVFLGVGGLVIGLTALILFALWMESFMRGNPDEPQSNGT